MTQRGMKGDDAARRAGDVALLTAHATTLRVAPASREGSLA